jgi:transcriptional regulator NrdR family protein
MKCPKCNCPSRVIDSRIQADWIRRRRRCSQKACNFRFTTKEIIDGLKDRPIDMQFGRAAKTSGFQPAHH